MIYTCQLCMKSFRSETSEDEAQALFRKTFPDDEEQSIVCDTCYQLALALEQNSKLCNTLQEAFNRLVELYSADPATSPPPDPK